MAQNDIHDMRPLWGQIWFEGRIVMKILLSRQPAPDIVTWSLVPDIIQVCELTPDYDSSGVSAQVAANSAYEIMCLALNNVWESEQNSIRSSVIKTQ